MKGAEMTWDKKCIEQLKEINQLIREINNQLKEINQ